MCQSHRHGFTLIELSIVLVIIGLIVGGVLVGRDLINAATVRAQIAQIEKYNTAVNSFKGKYDYLPGDIPYNAAAQAGLATQFSNPPIPRGSAGLGDGNGLIEGIYTTYPGAASNGSQQTGETTWAWADLGAAGFVDGSFTSVLTSYPYLNYSATSIGSILPAARMGNGNFVYIYSYNSQNYWGVSAITASNWGNSPVSTSIITVKQAYSMDQKIDDGLPQSGNVQASALLGANGHPDWVGAAPGVSVSGAATTCYDNAGNAAGTMTYSLAQNNGAGANCAVSFKFQ